MAKQLKEHEKVGADFLDHPSTIEMTHEYDVPASHVWNSLLDGEAWTEWLPITNVTWTSPRPFSVGTTRTVEIGKEVVEETFFTWEDGKRMAFRFDRSTLPVKACAEDYIVEPTENGCKLTWRFRADAFILLKPLIMGQMKSSFAKGMPVLGEMIKKDMQRFEN